MAALTAQPDAVDLQACAGVTALTDASACEAKVANDNAAADPKACTYTAADPSTGAAATCVDKVSAARRTCLGRLGAVTYVGTIRIFLCKSVFYGASVWAHRALKHKKRRFPARAVVVAALSASASAPFASIYGVVGCREQQMGGSGGSLEPPGPLSCTPLASSHAPPYRVYGVF
jgi:hypothetical protein